MPLAPSTWSAGQLVTADRLNTDLYTYTPGNSHAPNGILFHANRQLLVESVIQAISAPSSGGGTYTNLSQSTRGFWKNYFDNAAMFTAISADNPGNQALGQFEALVPGASGTSGVILGQPAGAYLSVYWLTISAVTSNGTIGAALAEYTTSNPMNVNGGRQLAETGTTFNAGYVLDLMNQTTDDLIQPVAYCQAGIATYSVIASSSQIDYSGVASRFYAMWCGVTTGAVPSFTLPQPLATYGTGFAITSSFLNGSTGYVSTLSWLNYPPGLRVLGNSTSVASSGTGTVIQLTSTTSPGPYINTHGGFNSTTFTYTVPVSGVYLAHGLVQFSSVATGSGLAAGISVNGTTYWGPGYSTTGSSAAPQVTRLLDLTAGDTVQLMGYQNTGGALTTVSGGSRLVLQWMGSLGTGTTLTWSPPDTGYRWQAGSRASTLPGLFTTHLGNDLNFLMSRPYLMTWQSVAQAGLATGVFNSITMNQVNGRVHSSQGDNYGGWSGTAYVAKVAGWYLSVAGYSSTAPGAVVQCVSGISQTPSGSLSPDSFQFISNTSSVLSAGAEAIGFYYLAAGDSLSPVYKIQGGSSYSTVVTAGWESHFSMVWVSE